MATNYMMLITLITLISCMCISLAFDPSPLQDFCVADYTGKAPCKDPKTVTADDFYMEGLNVPANTSNPYGVGITAASVDTVPGFNGLGLRFARADFAPRGFIPPHINQRASEVVMVVEGALEVGFITSSPDYKYYKKTLKVGDIFIIPVGLIYTMRNVVKRNTVIYVASNSQNPGFIYIPDNVFAATPAVNASYLAAAFKLDLPTVKYLQRQSWFNISS